MLVPRCARSGPTPLAVFLEARRIFAQWQKVHSENQAEWQERGNGLMRAYLVAEVGLVRDIKLHGATMTATHVYELHPRGFLMAREFACPVWIQGVAR